MDVPSSFQLSVARGEEELRGRGHQGKGALYREQVSSPKNFVVRLLLPDPEPIDRLRNTVGQAFVGYYFSIYELRLCDSGKDKQSAVLSK